MSIGKVFVHLCSLPTNSEAGLVFLHVQSSCIPSAIVRSISSRTTQEVADFIGRSLRTEARNKKPIRTPKVVMPKWLGEFFDSLVTGARQRKTNVSNLLSSFLISSQPKDASTCHLEMPKPNRFVPLVSGRAAMQTRA